MVQSSSFIFASREPPAASSHHITSIVLRISPLTPCASQPTIFLYFHGCLCLLFSSKIDHSSRSAFSTSFHFRRPTFPSLAVVHRFSLSHSLKIVSRSVLSFFCVVFRRVVLVLVRTHNLSSPTHAKLSENAVAALYHFKNYRAISLNELSPSSGTFQLSLSYPRTFFFIRTWR